MEQCYAALPYLVDFEAGRSFREAHVRIGTDGPDC